MTPTLARKMWRTLEPYHGLVYFTPRATDAYAALGIHGRDGYFASRAAAMGPVGAEVVVATFYNFDPQLVRAAIPAAWEVASPAALLDARRSAADLALLDARRSAADLALRDALGDEVVTGDDMRTAAGLARRATEGCAPHGRPLYAAHAALPWPDDPHVALWHAITLLREFRGDGHVAALLVEGLDGCEALVTHGAAADDAVRLDVLQATRGWPDGPWEAARERLRSRGWLDDEGRLTADGVAGRARVEALTDELALAPWHRLGDESCDRLRALVRPWSKAIVATGALSGAPPSRPG
jgi:hypothetical protein